MITIQNLTKTYHTKSGEVEALRGISAEIRDGDIFGIIGLSGAGKSTLLRCIALLETPTSGSISIDGRDLSSLRGRQLTEHRRQIGVIFQGYNLLMQRTVSGNIAFPLEIAGAPKAEIRRRTEELIHLVGLDGKADAYPSQLSGGQCQRVAIARALANNPKCCSVMSPLRHWIPSRPRRSWTCFRTSTRSWASPLSSSPTRSAW